MTDDALRKLANRIQQKAGDLGVIAVVIDQERHAHVVPGSELEVLAVYQQGITRQQILEDLEFAGVER